MVNYLNYLQMAKCSSFSSKMTFDASGNFTIPGGLSIVTPNINFNSGSLSGGAGSIAFYLPVTVNGTAHKLAFYNP